MSHASDFLYDQGATITLESPSAHSRRIAVDLARAKVKHEREAWEAERTAALMARNEADAQAVVAIEARAEAARKALADELAVDAHEALAPPWAGFRKEPSRSLALKIAEAWRRLEARSEVELGAELNAHVIAVPLLELIGGNRAMRAGGYFDFSTANYGNAAERAIKAFATTDLAFIFDALVALETKVAEVVARTSDLDDELARRRFAAFKASPTSLDATRAIADVEARWKLEQDATRAAANQAAIGEHEEARPRGRIATFFGV